MQLRNIKADVCKEGYTRLLARKLSNWESQQTSKRYGKLYKSVYKVYKIGKKHSMLWKHGSTSEGNEHIGHEHEKL